MSPVDPPARRGWLPRLTSALRRRARYAWSRLREGRRPPPVEAALLWLLSLEAGQGIPASSAQAVGCPAVTRACLETLEAFGCREEARRCAAWLATQPSASEVALSPSAMFAAKIVRWYHEAERARADRAMRSLERRQTPRGGFPSHWGWFAPAARCEDTWTAKYYLDAALLRVRAAFEEQWAGFPEWIDPADGRVQAVRAWLASLGPGAHVADVGCGKGRFLRHLRAWFPQARLTGIDLAPAMLACLPEGVAAREGSLLQIPADDGEFDGAMAVESLEHALVPERAVAELCRVVRPGGRVLVIDKHRAKQPLSEHDPWERWFAPEELAGWLGRHCDHVTVRPVSHLEGQAGHDLFLAAEGRRAIREDARPLRVSRGSAASAPGSTGPFRPGSSC